MNIQKLAELAIEVRRLVNHPDSSHINCPFCHEGYLVDGVPRHEPDCIVSRIGEAIAEPKAMRDLLLAAYENVPLYVSECLPVGDREDGEPCPQSEPLCVACGSTREDNHRDSPDLCPVLMVETLQAMSPPPDERAALIACTRPGCRGLVVEVSPSDRYCCVCGARP